MRAVIYARYSTDLQSASSIDDQVRLCRERIERDGHELMQVYSDRAISGATLIRPGIQLLMQDANRGAFDVVYAEALDRMSRDQEDAAGLFKRMRFAGVKIMTLAEGEISELHVGLKGTMNALFLKDLAQKTRRGLQGRVLQGLSGGGLCYGYDLLPGESGVRRINKREAKVIRAIFHDYAAGQSPRAIAGKLNKKGIPGPSGGPWRDTAIRGHFTRGTGILNNELYVGRLVWNRLTRSRHLLSGLLFCQECGSRYASIGRDYLACSAARGSGICSNRQSVRRVALEGLIINSLRQRLMAPELVEEFVGAVQKEINLQRREDDASVMGRNASSRR